MLNNNKKTLINGKLKNMAIWDKVYFGEKKKTCFFFNVAHRLGFIGNLKGFKENDNILLN